MRGDPPTDVLERRSLRALSISVLAHIALVIAFTRWPPKHEMLSLEILRVSRVEIDFERAPPPTVIRPSPTAPLAPQHGEARSTGSRPVNRNARGVIVGRAPHEVVSDRPAQTAPEPPDNAPPTAAAPRRTLTAAELFTPGIASTLFDGDSNRGPAHPGRSLFGNHSGVPDVDTVARAPTETLLAGSVNRQASGTMEHDRLTSRRVAEELVSLNQVHALGRRVMRSPVLSLPSVVHVESAGEVAAAEAAEFGHGSNGLPHIVQGGSSTCPPPHVLRIVFEVDQPADESIASLRMTRRSGIGAVDSAARAALESTLGSIGHIGSGEARHSVWAVEIANRLTSSIHACTDGWMVFPHDAVDGVYLMIRVARVRP